MYLYSHIPTKKEKASVKGIRTFRATGSMARGPLCILGVLVNWSGLTSPQPAPLSSLSQDISEDRPQGHCLAPVAEKDEPIQWRLCYLRGPHTVRVIIWAWWAAMDMVIRFTSGGREALAPPTGRTTGDAVSCSLHLGRHRLDFSQMLGAVVSQTVSSWDAHKARTRSLEDSYWLLQCPMPWRPWPPSRPGHWLVSWVQLWALWELAHVCWFP